MSLALVLILGGAAAAAAPVRSPPPVVPPAIGITPDPTYGPPAAAETQKANKPADGSCQSRDARDIVVCAQRTQGYRLDPSVMDAEREVESSSRSASAPVPAAQAICSASPMGCGTGLEGLDLANAAVVIGTAAIKAAKGEDWTRPFKTAGSDEYQLYLQAKQQREAREEQERAEAAALKSRQSR